jgi:hypothetical protein
MTDIARPLLTYSDMLLNEGSTPAARLRVKVVCCLIDFEEMRVPKKGALLTAEGWLIIVCGCVLPSA